MPSSTGAEQSFNILGSSKLNTSDGKNPSVSSSQQPRMDGLGKEATGSTSSDNHLKQCASAHDELEAKLKDQELSESSRGWTTRA
ncbi:MAG: hypothetical protein Q9168_001597 [Polycauliona sp. 1 TL-2023]